MAAADITVQVFIENEAGSSIKNTYDEDTLEHLGSTEVSSPYPYAYGFARGTRGGDGDALDCFVITDRPLRRGEEIACIPLHLLEQIEDGETDHKILCVPADRTGDEPAVIPEPAVAAIRSFVMSVFAHIPDKRMELGSLRGAEDAAACVRACQEAVTREN